MHTILTPLFPIAALFAVWILFFTTKEFMLLFWKFAFLQHLYRNYFSGRCLALYVVL